MVNDFKLLLHHRKIVHSFSVDTNTRDLNAALDMELEFTHLSSSLLKTYGLFESVQTFAMRVISLFLLMYTRIIPLNYITKYSHLL